MDRNKLSDFEKSGHLLLCLSPKLQLRVGPLTGTPGVSGQTLLI